MSVGGREGGGGRRDGLKRPVRTKRTGLVRAKGEGVKHKRWLSNEPKRMIRVRQIVKNAA